MPVLDNPRHERFAQYLLKGKSAAEAYVMAGYRDNRHNAAALGREEHIITRLKELQTLVAERAETTAADIARQLDEDRELAREVKAPAAAVSASMGKAKLFGLIKERHEHTGANGGPIKHDMSVYSDEHLAQLATILASASNDRGGAGGNPPAGGETKR